MENLEDLKKRLLKVQPDAILEPGVFNEAGEIIIRLTLPGVKVIECTNVNALAVIVTNLEEAKRAKSRIA